MENLMYKKDKSHTTTISNKATKQSTFYIPSCTTSLPVGEPKSTEIRAFSSQISESTPEEIEELKNYPNDAQPKIAEMQAAMTGISEWEVFPEGADTEEKKRIVEEIRNDILFDDYEEGPEEKAAHEKALLEEFKKLNTKSTELIVKDKTVDLAEDSFDNSQTINTKSNETINKYADIETLPHEEKIGQPSKTSIMDYYAMLGPKMNRLDTNKKGLEIYKVKFKAHPTLMLKCVETAVINNRKIDSLIREYNIGKTLGAISENVVKTLDMKQIKLEGGKTIRIEILMEYGGQSLGDIEHTLTREQAIKAMYQLGKLLEVLEEIGIAHFDLKPDNVLWDGDKIKLIDFGASVAFYGSPEILKKSLGEYTDRFIGYTPSYAPPEALKISKHSLIVPQKMDVFCFGTMFAEIILAANNFCESFDRNYDQKAHKHFVKSVKEALTKYGETHWINLITSCLSFDPAERPSFKEIIKKFKEILKSIKLDSIMCTDGKIIDQSHYMQMGKVHDELEEYQVALWYYLKCIEGMKLQVTTEELAGLYISIGDIYRKTSKNEEAMDWLKKAETLCQSFPHKLSTIYNVFGLIYQNTCQYEEAAQYYKKSINNTETLKGKDSISLVAPCNNLGTVYQSMKNYDMSAMYYNKAVYLAKKCYGEEHALVGKLYDNISTVFSAWNTPEIAMDYSSESISILKKCYGEDHISLAIPYNNIGILYYKMSSYKDAAEQFCTAINIVKKNCGEDHISLAAFYNNLGSAYNMMEKPAKALECFKKAIKVGKKVYGEESNWMGKMHYNLGAAYFGVGKKEVGMECCKRYYGKIEIPEGDECIMVFYTQIGKAEECNLQGFYNCN